MKIYIKNLGCKANRYEADKLAEDLIKFGVDVIFDKLCNADMYIINTCTVTHTADRKSRQCINIIKNHFKDAKIIVFGCGPRVDFEGYKKIKGIKRVCTSRKEVMKCINEIDSKVLNKKGDLLERQDCKDASLSCASRTRAPIKIQDGCNNFCSYCIIPFARGIPVSRPFKKIISEIKDKERLGFKEIVITGININKYCYNGLDLVDLLEIILNSTKTPRIRLSSIEPMQVTEKFIKVFKNKRFCKHIHASLQSGSAKILKLMNRKYNPEEYLKMSKLLKLKFPNIALTTDIIVGFPGESEKNFDETMKFCKKIGFSKIHVFKFSKRKGTAAAQMKDQITEDEKKLRSTNLQNLSQKLRTKFIKSMIGKKKEVLFEKRKKEGLYQGFTDNYVKVYVSSKKSLTNMIKNIKLKEVYKDGILGRTIRPI